MNAITESKAEASTTEKLAAARGRAAEREAARAKDKEARELELLELEERLEKETGGKRGKEFQIIDSTDGPIAVKLGEPVLWKRLSASKAELEDLHGFVAPCIVYPDKEAAGKMLAKRQGLVVRVSDALIALYRGEEEARQGK